MKNYKLKGQAMLLTVLILGSTILAASTIAGYLTVLKIRASSDTTNSAKAIFAADTGIEWELYNVTCVSRGLAPCPIGKPTFSPENGAGFDSSNVGGVIKSRGQSGNIFRAFEANLSGPPTP